MRTGIRGIGLLAAAAVAGLSACGSVVTVQSNVDKDAKPTVGAGYIAGSFSRIEGSGFGFVVTDQAGRDRNITFGEKFVDAASDVTGLVAVPPGMYRVTGWITFDVGSHFESNKPQDVRPPHPLARPFEVKPGHVVYLGTFEAKFSSGLVSPTKRRSQWSVQPRALRADEVVEVVRKAYPPFGGMPMECLLCIAPRAGAEAAAPAFALPTAGRKATLHYHRSDGNYQGLGLWAWESRSGAEGTRRDLTGASREHPLAPTGVDAFGAYWAMDQGEFRNGRVSFVIRRGAEDAEGDAARSWLIQDSSDAWVNSDDGFLYLERKDALRWQQKE